MLMIPAHVLHRKERKRRDALRGRMGNGTFSALVRELARVIVLAFEAGDTGSLFGLEGPLRHGIRSDLCLQGWKWKDADTLSREALADAFRLAGAIRPSWNEGQLEWTIEAGTLIERTRCARCGNPLPEGHYKFCGRLCASAHSVRLHRLKNATEEQAVKMATNSI
jgi:hypothetical protein